MILSMTGFGEKRFYSETLSVKISVKSLNHRYFDWNYYGSQAGEMESRLKAVCQKKIRRGRIEVSLEINFLNQSGWDVRLNKDLFQKVASALKEAASLLEMPPNMSVENLFRIPEMVEIRKKDFSKEEITFLQKCFEEILDEVIKERKREGGEIERAIKKHLRKIKAALKKIEKFAGKQPLLIRDKMRERLKELTDGIPLLEDKLIEEAGYYAQKYDLSEEIERLKSHINYFQKLLQLQSNEPVGRKMDFIAQELYREINTVGSKAQEVEIIKESIAVKSEVESIRQQVQNIE